MAGLGAGRGAAAVPTDAPAGGRAQGHAGPHRQVPRLCGAGWAAREFPYHRLVLAACSPYFRARFLAEPEERKPGCFRLEGCPLTVVAQVLPICTRQRSRWAERRVCRTCSLRRHRFRSLLSSPSACPSCRSACAWPTAWRSSPRPPADCAPRMSAATSSARASLVARDAASLGLSAGEPIAIISSDGLKRVEKEEAVFGR